MNKVNKKIEANVENTPFIDHYIKNNILIIHPSNILFMHNILQLENIWKQAYDQESIKMIAVDCNRLELIDSTAIGTLVKLLNETKKHNLELVMYSMKAAIINLFKTAKLTDFFRIMSKQEFENFIAE